MSDQKSKPSKSSSHYLKYTGMVFQLFIMLALLIYFGQYIDDKLGTRNAYFTAFLPLIGLIIYFYKIYVDLIQD